ncbi:MAG TPA: SCP2 sterol-binding domain-containing protein [Solirubrobacteraceae bacterium]|jgi:putative sterol carrier protein|nr:SCP2 sterol-binding domain-containing protein [Solirubrobacteraceae bacterium]
MGFFASSDEVDQYIGGMFRQAADHPEVGPKMKAANITLLVDYTDPDCRLLVKFQDPMTVELNPADTESDITLFMKADTADQYWRGQYNLAVGLAKGQVKAKGPVNKILKLVPLTKPLFPVYNEMVAEKDSAGATA